MAIGYQIKKYQAQKAAQAAGAKAEAATEAHEQDHLMEEHVHEEKTGQDSMAPAMTPPAPVAPAMTPPAPVDPTMAAVLAQIAALMDKLVSMPKTDANIDTAAKQVELIERLITKTHPENVDHPGISVYSYPEGDVARPKPDMKCKIFWVGYELRPETMTPQEIDLLNRLEPGEYRVTKADGTGIPFRVQGENSDKLDDEGRPRIGRLSISFPCKNEARQNHMSMVSYIQQVLGDRIATVAEMMMELDKMKRELALAKAGVVGVV